MLGGSRRLVGATATKKGSTLLGTPVFRTCGLARPPGRDLGRRVRVERTEHERVAAAVTVGDHDGVAVGHLALACSVADDEPTASRSPDADIGVRPAIGDDSG